MNFDDDTGYQEHAASEAFPGTGAIEARATCAAPTVRGRPGLIESGRILTVAKFDTLRVALYGFGEAVPGVLDDTTFSIGTNRYEIEAILVHVTGGINVVLNAELDARDKQSLSVHVCDKTLHFKDASHVVASETYTWSGAGLDWSNHAERTIYLSRDTSSLARAFISNVGQQQGSLVSNETRATAFTTGRNSTGYEVTSVEVYVPGNHTSGVTPRVEIFEDSAGAPGTPFATLINPATIAANAISTFNAQPNTILDPNTVYWLGVSNPDDAAGQGFFVQIAPSNMLDGAAAMGWSMGNGAVKADIRSPTWTNDTLRFLFAVRGTVVAGGANAAPTAADNTVETAQDTAYTFTAEDFGFADADAADTLASVKIATLPAVGTLALDGTAVMADEVISKVDIDEGDLTFTPVAGATGDAHANFTFKVNDGRDDSANAYTMSITVNAAGANTAQTGADKTVETAQDTAYAFDADDFGFTDADAADTLASVKIATLPAAGALALDGTEVMADEVVTSARIDDGDLTFTPVAGESGDPYTSFTFKVNDGTVDSASAYTMSITVNAADTNTAPTAADNTVTTGEDRPYTFTADDFEFADDDAADTLASVKIVTPPAAGALALDGTAVTADEVVTKAQIDADMLIFRPARDAHGDPYTTFTFKVNDGTDDSTSAYTMTIDVTDSPPPVCAVPDIAGDGRRQIWTGTVEVDEFTVVGETVHGYTAGHLPTVTPAGELDDRTFTIGSNDYTVRGIFVEFTGSFAGSLYFEVPAGQALTNRESAALRLHVCDMPYDFSSATNDLNGSSWTGSLDWSDPVATRTLYLSLPANNAATGEPAITGTATTGQELTADTSPIMDTDGLTGVDFTYQWLRVDADGTSNEEDITGEIAATYTLTDDDVGKKVKVEVSFTD